MHGDKFWKQEQNNVGMKMMKVREKMIKRYVLQRWYKWADMYIAAKYDAELYRTRNLETEAKHIVELTFGYWLKATKVPAAVRLGVANFRAQSRTIFPPPTEAAFLAWQREALSRRPGVLQPVGMQLS